jgi:hypothetical protein
MRVTRELFSESHAAVHIKWLLLVSYFNDKPNSVTNLVKHLCPNFKKFHPVCLELLRADAQRNKAKVTAAFFSQLCFSEELK